MEQPEEIEVSSISRDASRPTAEKRRTLRTYSKRSRPTEDEPTLKPVKKQKIVIEDALAKQPELPRIPPPPPAHTSNIPKSSILSYFKPCRSSSATEPSDPSDPLSDSEKLIDTPPSSPPIVKRIREPRRLRLRHSLPSSDGDDAEADKLDNGKDDETATRVTRSSRRERKQLQEAKESKLNAQKECPAAKSQEATAKPKARSKPVATIQTTINISSKPTFEECKVCRMVYNPLHPPDVKFHIQTHAAHLRKKAKARAQATM
ncbi:hypothetical protein CcaCcLH18_06758 [Colletotrichum camelliae]|nr:hypothetical protein CcaCcLH18_06758 [Colletotrichum camelliae]